MSVSVRLTRVGKKGQPVYRIVVCETRSKRDGRYRERLGYYNPNVEPPTLKIDRTRLQRWVSQGAIISSGLRQLLKKSP